MKSTVEGQLGIISSVAVLVLVAAGVLSFQNTQSFVAGNTGGGSAEVFGAEPNSSAVLSHCPAMKGPTYRLEVPQRKADFAYLCATPLC
jgi:hypothetical protein